MNKNIIKANFLKILESNAKDYKICEHEPVLNFEKAAEIDKRFGLTGKESKALFIKGKSGKFYIYLTTEDKRMDSKIIKDIVGEKVNIVPSEEMITLIGCEPGCLPPFGYDKKMIDTIIVDNEMFKHEKFICSSGIPEMTIEIETKYLKTILDAGYDKVLFAD